IKVLKEADERDSAYWEANAKIPSTDEEQRAYERADSVKAAMDSTKYDVGLMDLLVGGTTGSDHVNVSFPGLLGLYHFNRVEGHALEGSASFRMPDIPLRTLSAMAGYGFNDKRMKWSVAGGVQIFDTPRLQLTAERYATLGFFDQGNRLLGTAGTTLTTLLLKYDLYDYFYQDGWSAGTSYDLLMLFPVSMSVSRNHYLNAVNTTNESIFRRDWIFRENPAINEGSILSVYGEVTVDARDFIDNAGVIRRFGTRNHVPTVGIGWHQADIEGTQWEYLSWTARLNGSFEFGIAGAFAYRLVATGTGGPLATQSLYSLPGSIEYFADSRRFRTLGFREFGGDRRVTAMFTYNLRDWLFRASGLPLLAGSGLGVELFASSGWATMTDATRSLQRVHVSEAKLPFWEVGFGIDNILTLFRIDFAWRLNHFRPGRNFFFGLNAGVLL
ncbi:MAG: hypothetical protein KFF77_07870, partial [Bacteroidetes bacterium]|nr:hypothetical protein [Bacteroidota bacterium]